MKVLHEAMEVVLEPLQNCELEGFAVMTRALIRYKCVPLPISFSCDIRDGEDMSAMRKGAAVRIPCVRCKVTGNDIIDDHVVRGSSLRHTKMPERSIL